MSKIAEIAEIAVIAEILRATLDTQFKGWTKTLAELDDVDAFLGEGKGGKTTVTQPPPSKDAQW